MKIRDIIPATVTIVLAAALIICAPDLGAVFGNHPGITLFTNHPDITLAVTGILPQLDNDRLVPDPVVARHYLGVCLRTLARWDANPSTGFPPAIRINRRKFRLHSQLVAFMRTGSAVLTTAEQTERQEAAIDGEVA